MRPIFHTSVHATGATIEQQLELERTGPDTFRALHNQGNFYRSLFGGQVVAQSLAAGTATVGEGFAVHSCHSYFLRAGHADFPVDFAVERTRDGRRFTSRRIVASQNGKPILSMEASFRTPLTAVEHQVAPFEDPDPDKAMDSEAMIAASEGDMREFLVRFLPHYPIELRIASPEGYMVRGREPFRRYWLRAREPITGTAPGLHELAFAYLSDFMLGGVPLAPHMIALPGPHVTVASLDHAIWFHRPLRADEWLYFETDSPSAGGGTGLARARVYDRSGTLVASTAQEALYEVTG